MKYKEFISSHEYLAFGALNRIKAWNELLKASEHETVSKIND